MHKIRHAQYDCNVNKCHDKTNLQSSCFVVLLDVAA